MMITNSKRRVLLFLCATLTACSASADNRTNSLSSDEDLYRQFLEVTDAAEDYKKLTQTSCITNSQARTSIPVICSNLGLFEKIPSNDINLLFLPYAKQHIESRYLPELISYYQRQDIREIGKKIKKWAEFVNLEELTIYNKINNTSAGQQYSHFISDNERFIKTLDFSTQYILRHQDKPK